MNTNPMQPKVTHSINMLAKPSWSKPFPQGGMIKLKKYRILASFALLLAHGALAAAPLQEEFDLTPTPDGDYVFSISDSQPPLL